MSYANESMDRIMTVSAEDVRTGIEAAHTARAEAFRDLAVGLARIFTLKTSLNRHNVARRSATPCAEC
ncbi:hypothetical protein KAJ83_03290 [Marivibrio halodurans]|uniref:Uncharacterized protein n=1 Tax=Marivibrio halodurans TaxID=2039722 RepID=A0A8J7V1P1_9PROT|nr:hypothetical protein [Marivibrio halodurans]MBP5856017.1 hypothetical protein [Marivibrio halodurans]